MINVCIVDDNVAVCDSLKFLFTSILDVEVKVYTDPLEFLYHFNADWNGCLIIDLSMPAMNGIDLIRHLKKINPRVKIIVISGHGSEESRSKALASGASAFISKPFKADDLLDHVRVS